MKGIFDKLKRELVYLGIVLVILLVVFKIIFFKENLLNLIRTVISIFWLFAVPGHFIMVYWKDRLDFTQRIVVGTALAIAINGILSYYLGLMGLHIKFHIYLIPLMIVGIGLVIFIRKKD